MTPSSTSRAHSELGRARLLPSLSAASQRPKKARQEPRPTDLSVERVSDYGLSPDLTLTAALFVGGLSTRMGRDKALLEIAGEPLWLRQLNLLRQLKPAAICISARSKPCWCPEEIAVVLDERPSRGPLSGLAAVLGQMQTSHLFALAVDLTQMNVDPINQLLTRLQPGRGIVPETERGFEPLCAIYPREAASLARAALEGGELSLQSLVRRLVGERLVAVHAIVPSEKGFFLNLNSPADLKGGRR